MKNTTKQRNNKADMPIPLAYFITFSCYGTHLHGQESGSVDRNNNLYGQPYLSLDAKIHQHKKERMKQDPYYIETKRGHIILNSIIETSKYRQWNLLAVHIRSTHVHIIIQALVNPEKVMNDLKAYASRALNKAGYDNKNRKRWTKHGSTRYLWKVEDIEKAIHYVLHEQGEVMVLYESSFIFSILLVYPRFRLKAELHTILSYAGHLVRSSAFRRNRISAMILSYKHEIFINVNFHALL